MSFGTKLSCVVIGFLFVATSIAAQGRDLGDRLLDEELRRQREEAVAQGGAGQEITIPQLPGPVAEPACFPISEISLAGRTVLSGEDFAPLLEEFSNQCLGQESIGILLQRVSAVYADRGYITSRAYVPAQDVSGGKLLIEVLEGRIEAFLYQQVDTGGDPRPGKTRKVKGAFPAQVGDVFQLRDIEHGLEQMNRLRSSQASANLIAGQAPGTSQIVITEQKVDPVRGSVGIDNLGDEATGETRLRFALEVDDLLQLNDSLFLSYSGSRNSNALAFNVSVPYRKWLFSASGSYSESLSPVSQFSDLLSQTANVNLTAERNLLRSARAKVSAYLTASSYWNERYINIAALSPQHRSAVRLGLRNEYRSEKYVLYGDTSLSFGAKFLDADWDPDVQTPGAPRAGFEKIETRLTYVRPFENGRQLMAVFTGQHADSVLFSNEQLSIGGWGSVRGFANNAAAGDTGGYLRTELSFPSKPLDIRNWGQSLSEANIWNPLKQAHGGIRPFVFADLGYVRSRLTKEGTTMAGVGFGISMQVGQATFNTTLAVPLTDRPGQRSGNPQVSFGLDLKLF